MRFLGLSVYTLIIYCRGVDDNHGKVKYVLVHPETNTKSLTLEDAFINAGKTKYNDTNYYAMQDMDSSICSSTILTGNDSAIKLIDIRDNQLYTVAKLKDGNCWMIDNLNLGDIDNYPLIANKLDCTNTNLPNDPTKEISATTFNSWKVSSGSASYITPEYIPLNTTNTSNGLDTDPVSDTKYGTLYNYCAASANTYCYPGGSGIGNASFDLCPAGWRLPTGGSSSEFYNLATVYGYTEENTSSSKFRKSLTNGGVAFGLTGNFFNSYPVKQGVSGNYWASTQENGTYMGSFLIDAGSINPPHYTNRYYGRPVRCIAE